MVSTVTHGDRAITKGVELFLALVESRGATSLSSVARQADMPLSTAHRIAGAYLRSGLLARVGRGRYAAGLRLAIITQQNDAKSHLATTARPILRRLAKQLGATVHLGILEEGMVTYLVKEHGGGEAILTREMKQLEGYGSAIGKVLLAHLDQAAQEAYLANGPFVPLTLSTITDPAALRSAFEDARVQGYAFDNAEMENNLFCLAVPVYMSGRAVHCAISVSLHAGKPCSLAKLKSLQNCATQIAGCLARNSAVQVTTITDRRPIAIDP